VYYQGRKVLVDRAHNLWLDLALSAGLPAVLVFAVLLALIAREFFTQSSASYRPYALPLRPALAGAIAGHLADMQASFDLAATATVFWLLLALAASRRGGHAPAADSTVAARRSALIYFLPAALLVVLLIGLTCVRPLMADMAYAASLDGAQPLTRRLDAAEEATRAWPIEPQYHTQLAMLYFEAGFVDSAESEFSGAIALAPDDPHLWALRGDLYARWAERLPQRLMAAEGAYRRAVELAPNIAAYHAALGWVLARQNRLAEAAAALERAVALDATDAEAYRSLADVYARLGRIADANVALLQAEHWSKP
jgi:tetratricopeptide (TPR) repeat protein